MAAARRLSWAHCAVAAADHSNGYRPTLWVPLAPSECSACWAVPDADADVQGMAAVAVPAPDGWRAPRTDDSWNWPMEQQDSTADLQEELLAMSDNCCDCSNR